ncbi:hypothetical protein PGDDIFCJ_00121 [Thermus phage YS40_Isch]|nr:hypothetical protein PGDDIFCJ_00121 [Thermus phage YS40_Isch]
MNTQENKVKIYCHPAFELVEVIFTLEETFSVIYYDYE